MATALPVSYSGPSGARIFGGKYTTRLSGTITLEDLISSGTVGTQASTTVLSGTITLDDLLASGGTALTWAFTDSSTINTGRNTTTVIATNVPTGAYFYASPDLLPGQSLVQVGSEVRLVGDNTVPTVDGSSSGSALDIASGRDVVIEVMDTPMARARNLRYPLIWWGAGESSDFIYGMVNGRSRVANVLDIEYGPYKCQSGDIIEITPGAVAQTGDGIGQDGTTSYMHARCSVTIKNVDGRGRWRLLPPDQVGGSGADGITIHRPIASKGERNNVVIEGFVCDTLGDNATPIVLRRDADDGTYMPWVASLTVRNFRLQNRANGFTNSGMTGGAETILLEDGYVADFGNGSGQEHNLYISAHQMTLRGVRSARTRGWVGLPWNGGSVRIDGHMAKFEAVTGLIEGCVFDSVPMGDQSLMLQMKAGGNWIVQGCLFRDSQYSNVAKGAINMCREMNTDGVTPNFKTWAAGSEGNSLIFRRNVYIGHYPRPIIFFFPQGHGNALAPATGGSFADNQRLQSLVVEDNIGMVTSSAPTAAADFWKLPGFATQNASTKPMWIMDDPNAGQTWGDRGNLILPYFLDEYGFDNKELFVFNQSGGPVAASAGTLSTRRFVYPHGSIARSDAYKGLA